MNRLVALGKKAVRTKRTYLFYRYSKGRQGEGEPHEAVRVYAAYRDIPVTFRQVVLPRRYLNVMYYRLQRGLAKLLCYSEDGRRLQAYGWVQAWQPFRRRFRMVAERATMLGPYWTAPDERGKGIYVRLLRHSLYISPKDAPVLVCTSPHNVPSQRGIEKAGFEPVGKWEVTVWFRWLVRWRKLPGWPAPGSGKR